MGVALLLVGAGAGTVVRPIDTDGTRYVSPWRVTEMSPSVTPLSRFFRKLCAVYRWKCGTRSFIGAVS